MKESALRFAIVIAVCYLVAYGVARPVAYYLFSGTPESVRDNIALAIGMIFFTGLNYVGQRQFVFRTK